MGAGRTGIFTTRSWRLAPASRWGYVKKDLLVQGDVDFLP